MPRLTPEQRGELGAVTVNHWRKVGVDSADIMDLAMYCGGTYAAVLSFDAASLEANIQKMKDQVEVIARAQYATKMGRFKPAEPEGEG